MPLIPNFLVSSVLNGISAFVRDCFWGEGGGVLIATLGIGVAQAQSAAREEYCKIMYQGDNRTGRLGSDEVDGRD